MRTTLLALLLATTALAAPPRILLLFRERQRCEDAMRLLRDYPLSVSCAPASEPVRAYELVVLEGAPSPLEALRRRPDVEAASAVPAR